MKYSLAILFIALFALSQYAKQFNYLECKLANRLDPSSAKQCDCEKQIVNVSDKELPASQNHTRVTIDEFYTGNSTIHWTVTGQLSPIKYCSLCNPTLCEETVGVLYRPPIYRC